MRELKIAYGNSRTAKFWSNKTTTFDELCEKLKTPIKTSETAEEYHSMKKRDRDMIKDKGGFVAGHLKDNRRKRENVACRSMTVYDVDNATPEFIANIHSIIRYKGCVYSTHSHTPQNPRVRILLPTTRDMTSDEYNAVGRYVAAELGLLGMLDNCSFEPQQLMYWPSVSANGEYIFDILDGEELNPDEILNQHPEWQDCSLLPTTPKESTAKKPPTSKQQDPLTKKGPVGLFCRLYTIDDVMEKFLSDVYEPCIGGRYTYISGESTAGVVVYGNGTFAYSHHATDPAYGKLMNAFDLVRIHNFYDDNPKKSYDNMSKFVMGLSEVKKQAIKERYENAIAEFSDDDDEWMNGLNYDRHNVLENSLRNIRLILENDLYLKNIVFNQLADGMEIIGEVPWKHPAKFWRDADDAQLISYIDDKYGSFSQRNYNIAVQKVTDDRSYHPIKDMFEALPEWDGIPRVDTLFIDYLGAEDNVYTRAVTRKILCAAYMRVYNPGTKFDSILVLNGEQGIGKSTIISRLGTEWYSDSLALSDMNDKTAAEKLQGYWIMEIGELAGMKKADIDKVKAFVSRQDDKYRASFGRHVTPHPRQCVFFGTTNSENGYLRDITGNRRFWNVRVSGEGKYKPWELDSDTVKQIWAEVIVLANAGEDLYLSKEVEEYAKLEQIKAMETDEREGIVREYLDTLLPKNWSDMDIYERRNFLSDSLSPKGTVQRTTVSNYEIWCECFGKPKADMQKADSYAIGAIMLKIEGWERQPKPIHIPKYGKQRIYKRI